MEGPSRLLLDVGALEGARAPLLLAPPDGAALLERHPGATVHVFDESARRGCPSATVGVRPTTRDHDVAVVFHPKGKRRRDYALAVASHALAPGGTLVLVGGKREGIKSAKKILEVREAHSGRHAKLFVAEPRADLDPELSSWEHRWDTGLGFEAVSYPGTFAEGRTDAATALLLATVELGGERILDLGCGSGLLGVEAKRRLPSADVTLADADHLAVAASRRTAELAGVQVSVVASDGVDAVPGEFDAILLNPPFHEGVATRASAAHGVLEGAAARLRGVLWIVANRFLPHEDVLQAAGLNVTRAAENGRFKVLRATRE